METRLPDQSLSIRHLFAEPPLAHVLENGLTLVHQRVQGQPLVSAQLWIRTGSIHEAPFLGSGLSHFLEHMLFKGTDRRGPGAIAAEVQAFGGQINAYTAYDRTVVYIDGPSEALAQSLDIIADMTLRANLPEDEVLREKGVILREIDMTLDDPDRILSRALFSTAYRQHPFKYPVIGLKPLFEKVDRATLYQYYKARYHPENMVLAVAGEYDEAALLEQVEAAFGSFPAQCQTPVILAEEPRQLARRECRLTGDYQIVRGLLGFKIPSMRHQDAPALDIIAAIIGSGYSARLRQRLREELNLVHAIGASTWNPGQPGLFIIQYQCDANKASAAEEAILSTLRALPESGFSEEDLRKARQFALVGEIKARQTASGLASRLGLLAALVGDLHYPESFFAKVSACRPESLQKLSQQTFLDENLTIATLLPKSADTHRRKGQAHRELDPFAIKTLPNGARLIWQRDTRLPRTWFRYAGLAGPQYDPPGRQGATSLLATLMTKDTLRHSAFEIARTLENDGGFLSDSSGNNTFSLAVEVLPECAAEGLRYLREAVLEPAFKQETLERERLAQIAQIKEMEDEILEAGRVALRRRFFGNHPFASDPFGTVESVRAIDRPSLLALHSQLVVAQNAVLVISGDFDPDELLPLAEDFLRSIPESQFSAISTPPCIPAEAGRFDLFMNREQSVVFDAFPDVGIRPMLGIAAEIIDEVLSDMSGPLFRSVREEQSLAYFVGAYRLLGTDFGAFILYAGTHPESREAVFQSFDEELARIRSGNLLHEEIEAAQTRLTVQNRFSLQSPANRAAQAALNALYHKPIMDWLHYEDKVRSVTSDDLTRFANTYLIDSKRLRGSIGPSKAES
jgi:zinc protease